MNKHEPIEVTPSSREGLHEQLGALNDGDAQR